ncbi:hypothetical protein [Paenibacillus odorifer]|uniref:hypothetical protein n=1 Tax=Paenibacillus odorifer TaxID=189426 RepID=UPI00096E8330|nr:hypothetical protein [Paenibacillus odorifer]OMD76592.1 hypothetical protein BSK50_14960 [Paenibacillus odorifer]
MEKKKRDMLDVLESFLPTLINIVGLVSTLVAFFGVTYTLIKGIHNEFTLNEVTLKIAFLSISYGAIVSCLTALKKIFN